MKNIKRKTIQYDHKRELSEETKAKYMDQVAMLQREKELLEEDKSETAKDFNAQIKGKEEQISDLCGRVRVGHENITITAYEVWDYEAGEIRVEHSGTGEVLERREMTESERQQGLFDGETIPAPAFRPSCLDHGPDSYPVRNYRAGPRGEFLSYPRPDPEKHPELDRSYLEPEYLCETCDRGFYEGLDVWCWDEGADERPTAPRNGADFRPWDAHPYYYDVDGIFLNACPVCVEYGNLLKVLHDPLEKWIKEGGEGRPFLGDLLKQVPELESLSAPEIQDAVDEVIYVIGNGARPPKGWLNKAADQAVERAANDPNADGNPFADPPKSKSPARSEIWIDRLDAAIINAVNEGRMVDGYPDQAYILSVFGWPSEHPDPTEAEVRAAFERVRDELQETEEEAA